MDAVLTPHRSLSRRGMLFLVIAFAALNAIIAAFFLAQGAWPVLFFNAIDVLLLILALRLNFRDARVEERVRVGGDCVHVMRRTSMGQQAHWVVNPFWVRATVAKKGVEIAAGKRAVYVGAFLSPQEQAAFGIALRAALAKAQGR
jgi:uncharacterized membrane protein